MKNNAISDIKKLILRNKNTYLISEIDDFSDENDFLNSICEFFNKDINIMHIIPSAIDKKTVEYTKKLRELSSVYEVLLIIENRLDIARVCNADGVFFNKEGILINDILDISEGLIIGTNQQNYKGADYLLLGKNETNPSDIICFEIDESTSLKNNYKIAVKHNK